MLTRYCWLATGLLVVAAPVEAQMIPDDVAAKAVELRDAAMQDTIAYELVESLTMEVGPRPAESAGDKAAVRWAVQMLTGLGEVPGQGDLAHEVIVFGAHLDHTADDTLDKIDRDDLNQNVAA